MKKIKEFLQLINLTNEEIEVFLFLLQKGESSVYEISKGTKVSRTNIYRLCEQLLEKQFLNKKKDGRRIKYKIVSIQDINESVKWREKELIKLKKMQERLMSVKDSLSTYQSDQIKVVYYNGSEEVKQLIWNVLEAKKETLGYGAVLMDKLIGGEFMDRWRKRFDKLDLHDRQLLNKSTLKEVRSQNVKKSLGVKSTEKRYERRIIDKKLFKIEQETFIYNNIYSIIQYDGDQIFGVEIYNQVVADQQREIFEVLWKRGK